LWILWDNLSFVVGSEVKSFESFFFFFSWSSSYVVFREKIFCLLFFVVVAKPSTLAKSFLRKNKILKLRGLMSCDAVREITKDAKQKQIQIKMKKTIERDLIVSILTHFSLRSSLRDESAFNNVVFRSRLVFCIPYESHLSFFLVVLLFLLFCCLTWIDCLDDIQAGNPVTSSSSDSVFLGSHIIILVTQSKGKWQEKTITITTDKDDYSDNRVPLPSNWSKSERREREDR
jgi:hypothetical protein